VTPSGLTRKAPQHLWQVPNDDNSVTFRDKNLQKPGKTWELAAPPFDSEKKKRKNHHFILCTLVYSYVDLSTHDVLEKMVIEKFAYLREQ
jgi:hypothetical protein